MVLFWNKQSFSISDSIKSFFSFLLFSKRNLIEIYRQKLFSTIFENTTKKLNLIIKNKHLQTNFHFAWCYFNKNLMSSVVHEDMKIASIAEKIHKPCKPCKWNSCLLYNQLKPSRPHFTELLSFIYQY